MRNRSFLEIFSVRFLASRKIRTLAIISVSRRFVNWQFLEVLSITEDRITCCMLVCTRWKLEYNNENRNTIRKDFSDGSGNSPGTACHACYNVIKYKNVATEKSENPGCESASGIYRLYCDTEVYEKRNDVRWGWTQTSDNFYCQALWRDLPTARLRESRPMTLS